MAVEGDNTSSGEQKTMSTILDRVRAITAEKLSVDEGDITPESSFTEDLDADSLDVVELIMAFEEEFSTDDNQVEISDDDAESIQTVQNAVDYLGGKGVTG
ncbi:Acyl carrier protein [Geodia barretti]|uniref:Acyl carrier protein n=1 Tax=Geodia barretti TaxID=519541 RepID=A0AA35QVA6_GEOBA|nr:Acyl carrier protein [Geodia barretti]